MTDSPAGAASWLIITFPLESLFNGIFDDVRDLDFINSDSPYNGHAAEREFRFCVEGALNEDSVIEIISTRFSAIDLFDSTIISNHRASRQGIAVLGQSEGKKGAGKCPKSVFRSWPTSNDRFHVEKARPPAELEPESTAAVIPSAFY